jgi:hypothetical protein
VGGGQGRVRAIEGGYGDFGEIGAGLNRPFLLVVNIDALVLDATDGKAKFTIYFVFIHLV